MPLYHKDIGFPASIEFAPLFGLKPSHHALGEANKDRYGIIKLPVHFLPRIAVIIEIELTETGDLIKILARQEHDSNHDVVFAINPVTKVIKTAWLQEKNDNHRTLDKSKYDKP